MFSKKQLVSYGAEKLASAILALVKKNPSIQTELKQYFSCLDPDPVKRSKSIPIIEKMMKSLKTFEGIRYRNRSYDIQQIVSRIHEVRTVIEEAVLPVSPDQAVTLLTDFLDMFESINGRVIDEDCLIIGAFQEVCTDLGKMYELTTYSLNDVVDLVYKYHMNDGYAVYYNIIKDFSKVLGNNGMKELQQRLENCENGLDEVKSGLRNIADVFDDVDAYIETFSFKMKEEPHDHERVEIAKRLIKHGRGAEAIQWLDSAYLNGGFDAEKKRPLKIQALDLCGDHKAAQAERLNWFETTLDHEAYSGIVENAEADFVELFKKTAIEKALRSQNTYVVSDLLKKINDVQLLGKLVREKINSLDSNLRTVDTLHCIAKALQRQDPLAATLLFRKTVQCAFDDQCEYYFVKDLTACHTLSSKITDWEMFETHQQYFERISVEHKEETKLWQKYKLAFEKPNPKKAKLAIDQ